MKTMAMIANIEKLNKRKQMIFDEKKTLKFSFDVYFYLRMTLKIKQIFF